MTFCGFFIIELIDGICGFFSFIKNWNRTIVRWKRLYWGWFTIDKLNHIVMTVVKHMKIRRLLIKLTLKQSSRVCTLPYACSINLKCVLKLKSLTWDWKLFSCKLWSSSHALRRVFSVVYRHKKYSSLTAESLFLKMTNEMKHFSFLHSLPLTCSRPQHHIEMMAEDILSLNVCWLHACAHSR